MPADISSYVGAAAAVLASLSYLPQVRKAWPRGSTHDLSTGTLAALTVGLALWVVYGLMKADWVLVAANVVATGLTAIVLGCKIRDAT